MASSPKWYDRVMESVSSHTGTGTYTLAGAVTGYQTFAAVGNSNSCYYCAMAVDGSGNPSGGWETGIGTYTSSGTTLSRDKILASSNSGAAVSWSSANLRVFLCAPAVITEPVVGDMGGRLTTESGVPVSTSDRSSQGTLYYTPYLHNRVVLWDGSAWRRYQFAELSLSLTLTSGKNYDVFLYDNAGTLTLELSAAWTNDTTPADALTTQDGVSVKAGALTRRWLGTIRASGTNVIEDSKTKQFIYNTYNQAPFCLFKDDTTGHAYAGSGTTRQWRAQTANKVEFVLGAPQNLQAHMVIDVSGIAGDYIVGGPGLDTTTAVTPTGGSSNVGLVSTTARVMMGGTFPQAVAKGYHYLAMNQTTASSGTYNYGSITATVWR